MSEQMTLLGKLAVIDSRLDELHDELGDLPAEVKTLENVVADKRGVVAATQARLEEIRHLRGNANVSKQEMADRETRLTEQQFQVKNNREFDAITKEIENIKHERAALDERLRTAEVTEENLQAMLDEQNADLAEAVEDLALKEKELEAMTGEHNDELKKYIGMRLAVIAKLDDTLEAEYERIRTFHREAAVAIRRDSCSGCFSAIPSQRIMEQKYNQEKLYICENCGRILLTESLADQVEELVEEGDV
jgi:uncharacterized protein